MTDTTHEAPELLPCPFCGGEPYTRTRQDEDLSTHNIVDWHFVGCLDCDVSFGIPDGYDCGTASEQWNTRADTAQAMVAERDALAEAIDSEHSQHGNIWRFWRGIADKAVANRKTAEAERDALVEKLTQAEGALNICSWSWGECNRILEETEAKLSKCEALLAKAADVIDWALICWDDHNKHGYNMQGDWVHDARATLAAITEKKS